MNQDKKERKKIKWKKLLGFLLLGSVLLAGCSGRENSRETGAGWSFQAEQEEDSDGVRAGNSQQPDAEDGTAQPEYAAADGSDSLSGTAAAGTASADAGVSDRTGAPADAGVSDSAGTSAADSGVSDSTGTSAADAGSSAPAAQQSAPGYVYICGAVANPGVYEISEGTRVFEVIAQAGGLTEQADAEWLNQAETVLDGQKLQIYTKEETAAFREAGLSAPGQETAAGAGGTASGTASGGASVPGTAENDKVNINTADKDLLMTLPGIGESKAEAILQYRQEHGNFGSIEDICLISGIKEAVFSRIKDRITV